MKCVDTVICRVVLAGIVGLSSNLVYAENPFQVYDNKAMLGYSNSVQANGDSYGGFTLNVEALFDNNVWLAANSGYLLYVARANSPLNKITGAELGIKVGYAFQIGQRYNLIPFASANHDGTSISSGSTMSVVSYSDAYGAGLIQEYDIFPKALKFRFNTNFATQNTKTTYVSPVSMPDMPGYTTFINVAPSLQWNITDRVTTQFTYAYSINTLNFSNNTGTVNFSLGILF